MAPADAKSAWSSRSAVERSRLEALFAVAAKNLQSELAAGRPGSQHKAEWSPHLTELRALGRKLVNSGLSWEDVRARTPPAAERHIHANVCAPHGLSEAAASCLADGTKGPAIARDYMGYVSLFKTLANANLSASDRRAILLDAIVQRMVELREPSRAWFKPVKGTQLRIAMPQVEVALAGALRSVSRDSGVDTYLWARALALMPFGNGDAVYYVRNLAIAIYLADPSFDALMKEVHYNAPSVEIANHVEAYGRSKRAPLGPMALELATAIRRMVQLDDSKTMLSEALLDVGDATVNALLAALHDTLGKNDLATVALLGELQVACADYFGRTTDGFERNRLLKLMGAAHQVAYVAYPNVLEELGDPPLSSNLHSALVLLRSMCQSLVASERARPELTPVLASLDHLLDQSKYDSASLEFVAGALDTVVEVARTLAKSTALEVKARADVFAAACRVDVTWVSDQLLRSDPAANVAELAERLRNALPGYRAEIGATPTTLRANPLETARDGFIVLDSDFRAGAKGPREGVLVSRLLVGKTLEEIASKGPGPTDLVCVQDFGQSNPPQAGAIVSGEPLNPVSHIATWAEDEGVAAVSFPGALEALRALSDRLQPGEKIFVCVIEEAGKRRLIIAAESVARERGLLAGELAARAGVNTDVHYYKLRSELVAGVVASGLIKEPLPVLRHRPAGDAVPARPISLPRSLLELRVSDTVAAAAGVGTRVGKELLSFEQLGRLGEAAVALAGPKIATLARARTDSEFELADHVNPNAFALPFGLVVDLLHRSGALRALRELDLFATRSQGRQRRPLRESSFAHDRVFRRERLEQAQGVVREHLRTYLEAGKADALVTEVLGRLSGYTHFVARSSTQREDHVNLAGNGKFDSGMGRVCRADVVEQLVKVISSTLNPAAMDYAIDRGLNPHALEICVGFMGVPGPVLSGALKVHADKPNLACLQLTEGFGGGVAGTGAEIVTLDLETGKIVSFDQPYAAQEIERLRADGDGTELVSAQRKGERLATAELAFEIAKVARRAYALTKHLAAENAVVDAGPIGLDMELVVNATGVELVQARPLAAHAG